MTDTLSIPILLGTNRRDRSSESVAKWVFSKMRERAEWRHIRIVVLSAKGREAEVSKGLSLGADAYVTKPFSNRELMERIAELLGEGAPPDAP